MTNEQYVAAIEENIARREMYLSRLRLLHDRTAERGHPAIVEWILDGEAALNLAETMLHAAHEGLRTPCSIDHEGLTVMLRTGAAWSEKKPARQPGDGRRRAQA